jgi:hypothetical protein
MFKPFSDAYFSAEQRPGTSIIQVTRSAIPFTSASDVQRHFDALARALEPVDRSRHELLMDIRLAVGRNDPEFELAIEPYRLRIQRGFRRIAVVLVSIAGQLQIKRFAIQDRVTLRTFQDEEAALAWLGEKI